MKKACRSLISPLIAFSINDKACKLAIWGVFGSCVGVIWGRGLGGVNSKGFFLKIHQTVES